MLASNLTRLIISWLKTKKIHDGGFTRSPGIAVAVTAAEDRVRKEGSWVQSVCFSLSMLCTMGLRVCDVFVRGPWMCAGEVQDIQIDANTSRELAGGKLYESIKTHPRQAPVNEDREIIEWRGTKEIKITRATRRARWIKKNMRVGLMRWSCHIETFAKQTPESRKLTSPMTKLTRRSLDHTLFTKECYYCISYISWK